MKIIILFLSLTFFYQLNAQNYLTIELSNIKSNKGSIYIGIYNKTDRFLDYQSNYTMLKKLKPSIENNVSLIIDDLPKGTYAIAVFHDINNNKKLDKNYFGKPKEPFGVSNNIYHTFSEPTFSECKFDLQNNHHINVKISLNQ